MTETKKYNPDDTPHRGPTTVEENLPLAKHVFLKYKNCGVEHAELMAEANLGLTEGIDAWNRNGGGPSGRFYSRVSTYITKRLVEAWRSHCMGAMGGRSNVTAMGRHTRQFRELNAIDNPTDADYERIANESQTKVKAGTLKAMYETWNASISSMDSSIGIEEDGGTLHDILPSDSSTPEELLLESTKMETMWMAFDGLVERNRISDRMAKVWLYLFNPFGGTHNQTETAEHFGVSRQRIEQIQKRIESYLRMELERDRPRLVRGPCTNAYVSAGESAKAVTHGTAELAEPTQIICNTIASNERKCTQCCQVKLLDEFQGTQPGNHRHVCKNCMAKRARTWRQRKRTATLHSNELHRKKTVQLVESDRKIKKNLTGSLLSRPVITASFVRGL